MGCYEVLTVGSRELLLAFGWCGLRLIDGNSFQILSRVCWLSAVLREMGQDRVDTS